MTHLNKFYLILGLMVVVAGTMLFFQFRRSQNIDTNPTALPLVDSNFTEIPLTVEDKSLGNPGAPLLIVGFFDLNEKIDRDLAITVMKFIENNPQAAQFYLKHNPQAKLFNGDRSLVHRALICAGEQKKFWEYLSALAPTEKINDKSLTQITTDLKLNFPTWQSCWGNSDTKQAVADGSALALNLGIQTSPVIFVNNKKLYLDDDIDLMDLLNKFIEI